MKALIFLALLTLGTVQALTTLPLSLSEQARRAQVIVRATVGQPTNEKEGDIPYMAYPLTVSETILGDLGSLPQLNSKPALYFLQGASDLPAVSQGQEAIFLLYTGKMDSPVVGYNQGFYPLSGGKVTAGDLTNPVKLRDAIRAARGTK